MDIECVWDVEEWREVKDISIRFLFVVKKKNLRDKLVDCVQIKWYVYWYLVKCTGTKLPVTVQILVHVHCVDFLFWKKSLGTTVAPVLKSTKRVAVQDLLEY